MTAIWNNRSADTNGNICSTTARPASRLDPPRFSLRALEPDSTKRSGVHWVEEDLEVEEVMETPEVGPGDMLLMRDNATTRRRARMATSSTPRPRGPRS